MGSWNRKEERYPGLSLAMLVVLSAFICICIIAATCVFFPFGSHALFGILWFVFLHVFYDVLMCFIWVNLLYIASSTLYSVHMLYLVSYTFFFYIGSMCFILLHVLDMGLCAF